MKNLNLSVVCRDLRKNGVSAHVVTSMAVRSYKYEGEIIKDIHSMSRIIKMAFKDAPRYMNRDSSFKAGAPAYAQTFEYLAKNLGTASDVKISDKYKEMNGDIIVTLVPAASKDAGMAYFIYPNMIQISYAVSMLGAQSKHVTDFLPYLRGFDIAVEHELRHLVDSFKKTYGSGKLPNTKKTGSMSEYFNFEHEIDARITSLFVKLDQQFRGSALLALQGKVDAASKEHHKMLKANRDAFYLYCRRMDDKYDTQVVVMLTPENLEEVYGKCHEFQKFLIEEYGMALRVTKTGDITPAQRKAWTALLESTKDIAQHKETIKKIASK